MAFNARAQPFLCVYVSPLFAYCKTLKHDLDDLPVTTRIHGGPASRFIIPRTAISITGLKSKDQVHPLTL